MTPDLSSRWTSCHLAYTDEFSPGRLKLSGMHDAGACAEVAVAILAAPPGERLLRSSMQTMLSQTVLVPQHLSPEDKVQLDGSWVKLLYAWVTSKFSEANIDGPVRKDFISPRYHQQVVTDDRMGVSGNALRRYAGEPRSLR